MHAEEGDQRPFKVNAVGQVLYNSKLARLCASGDLSVWARSVDAEIAGRVSDKEPCLQLNSQSMYHHLGIKLWRNTPAPSRRY